jgi:CelD/BcsL family acetyltransferase involved in cellulose biosynthesis
MLGLTGMSEAFVPEDREMPGSVSISRVSTEHEFLSLRDEWNQLVESDDRATIFQTWEFQYHIWRIFADTVSLNLLLMRDEAGNLVGCAPLGVRLWRVGPLVVRVLGFSSINFSDYSDFILHPAYAAESINAIAAWIRGNLQKWDVVRLEPVREESWVMSESLFLCRIRDISRIRPCSVAPYLRFEDDWPSYEQALSKTWARNVRFKVRRLFREFPGRLEQAAGGAHLDEAFCELMALHQKRMRQKNQLGKFDRPHVQAGFRVLVRELGDRQLVKVHSIRSHDRAIASICTFEYRGCVLFFHGGFDPDYQRLSPGVVMHALCIDAAIKARRREYDFLLGNDPYKSDWANGQRRLHSIEITTGSWRRYPYDWWNWLRGQLVRSETLRATFLRVRSWVR